MAESSTSLSASERSSRSTIPDVFPRSARSSISSRPAARSLRIRRRLPPARFLASLAFAFAQVVAARWRRGPLLPTWSLRFESIVTALRRDWDGLWRLPAPVIRRHQLRIASALASPSGVRIERTGAGGVSGAWFEPPDPVPGAVLLYLHGGAFQFGSVETHAALLSGLSALANVTALAIEYRLAPEHPHPAARDDVLRAWHWLVSHRARPERIVVAGDSAGGNLCLGLLLALRERGEELPAAAALVSPWVDLSCSAASYLRNAAFDYGTREMLLAQARAWAGGVPLEAPALSPLHADLRGLPPLFVQYGGAELLRDEVAALADAAREAGVDVTLDVLRDMPHNGPFFAELCPEAKRGLERIARFVRERLEAPRPPAPSGPGGGGDVSPGPT